MQEGYESVINTAVPKSSAGVTATIASDVPKLASVSTAVPTATRSVAAVSGGAKVDLLEVAKGLNPDFAKNMPQEVADAFANGDVARIYRSSIDLPTAGNLPGSIPMTNVGGTASRSVQPFGDYSGSIYVQTKDGRTARFKGSSFDTDAGWGANHGKGAFLDEAFAVDAKAYNNLEARYGGMTVPDRSSVHAINMGRTEAAMTMKEASVAAARDIGTPVGETSGKNLLGLDTVEFSKRETGYSVHKGSTISDVFESSGERYYFNQPDLGATTRGTVASESIDDFMSRRGLPSATIASENATKVETLASEYDTGAKSADLVDKETPSVGTREARRDTVIDSLLKDENHPDPAKAEFNRRWNEQVLKDSAAPTNKAAPFGGMSDKAIEADIYDEVRGGASRAADVDLSTLSDEELSASKARVEKELMDLDAEIKKTDKTVAEARREKERLKARGKPKPGSVIINADGTHTVVKADDPIKAAATLRTDALTPLKPAAGAASSVSSPAATGASAASTVSGGGTARIPAAVASSSPPASAAARTAASVTAPSAARSTRGLVDNAIEVGQKLTRGHLGATALGVAAAGLLFGYASRDED